MSFDELAAPKRKAYPAPITRRGNSDGLHTGVVVVFTGALGLSRDAAADLSARAGMAVKSSVTRQTTHLVVCDLDLTSLGGHVKSSKQRKAEEMQASGHPVQIICEAAFKILASGTNLS